MNVRRLIRVRCSGYPHTISVGDDYARLDDHSVEDLKALVVLKVLGDTTTGVPACIRELATNPEFERRVPVLLADGSEGGWELYTLIIDALQRSPE